MKKWSRRDLEALVTDIVADAYRADEEAMRNFLRRKVGRWLVAKLLGNQDKPDVAKADSYLYKNGRLCESDMERLRQCYYAALIINEVRFFRKDYDRNVARNWLKMPCLHLEDVAPVCAIRDGRSYNHLSAVGAAKTFFFDTLK